jgi:hypothetical protein
MGAAGGGATASANGWACGGAPSTGASGGATPWPCERGPLAGGEASPNAPAVGWGGSTRWRGRVGGMAAAVAAAAAAAGWCGGGSLVRKGCEKKSSKQTRIIGSRCRSTPSSARHGGETEEGSLGARDSMFLRSWTWLAPVYGGRAVSSSNMIAPTDHRSAFASYLSGRRRAHAFARLDTRRNARDRPHGAAARGRARERARRGREQRRVSVAASQVRCGRARAVRCPRREGVRTCESAGSPEPCRAASRRGSRPCPAAACNARIQSRRS